MKRFLMKNQLVALLITAILVVVSSLLLHPVIGVKGIILANTFLTTKIIAREAVMRLRNFLVMKALVYPNYSETFQQQGDTIRVKKPAVYVADEFGGTINLQDIGEKEIDVTLNHLADVSVTFTSKERALNLSDFNQQILDPAMQAIAQKIDADIHKDFYKTIPYFVGESGTTPDGLEDFANAGLMLNLNQVPLANRTAVWDPYAHAKFTVLPAIVNAEKSGSTQALREGSIGRVGGFDNFMTQNVQTHTAGSFVNVAAPKVNTLAVVNSNTLILKGGAGVETITAGDIFYITHDGTKYYYTAASAATAVGGVVSITTYDKVTVAHAVDEAVVFPDKDKGGHVANLAFIKEACAFVSRPLIPPTGGAQSYVANFEGISIRVTAGYDMDTKKEILSLDTLYGVKGVYPQLATRVLG